MKLINTSKRCVCGKLHYMDDTDIRHICRCNRIVQFTEQEKLHYIKHEEELSYVEELA